MIDLIPDEGWNTDIIPGGGTRGYKNIASVLLSRGLVTYSNRNTYIFLTASNIWSVLISPESQIQLCNITGSDNVSVNYLSASIPYISYLEKNASRAAPIPVSICIGTRRLAISMSDNSINLTECRDIVKVGDKIDKRLEGFCVMPCAFNEIPTSWKPGGSNRIASYLSPLFPDPIEFETLKWLIGNAVVDPASVSKFILLYGPGGTGKSTVISIVEDMLKGCCGTIKSSTLTDIRTDMHIDIARAIASNRVLTAGDINLETNKLNLHTVKEMTGHDSVAVPPMKVATHCSLIAACNNLPNPIEQPSWTSTAISRRMVILVMNVKSSLIPPRYRPDTVEDNLEFFMSCVYNRLTNNSLIVSTRCLLYTVLGSAYDEIRDKIEITEDTSFQDIFDANTGIEIYLSLPIHTIGELASLVSMSAVIIEGDINFIKNIKLIEELKR